jgi:hypothetical protein
MRPNKLMPSIADMLLDNQFSLGFQTNAGLSLVIEWSIKATKIEINEHLNFSKALKIAIASSLRIC